MYSRPKPTDSEKEILEMQQKFLTEKSKNNAFEPAAKAIKIEKEKKSSLFAQSRKLSETKSTKSSSTVPLTNILLGEIVEKESKKPSEKMSCNDENYADIGFPRAEELDYQTPIEGKSLFAISLQRQQNTRMSAENNLDIKDNFGHMSALIQNTEIATSIHDANVKVLNEMTQDDILKEKEKIMESLDPKLIEFIQKKRLEKQQFSNCPNKIMKLDNQDSMETNEQLTISENINDIQSVSEIISKSEAEQWINFNIIEKEKLEWMKDIPNKVARLKSGESFEARFDWKGILLPYTEGNEDTDKRELYLHGDEAFRPGYTLQELFRLARSNIIQQRISAFGSICGILNIYNQGFYDNVLEVPITKIFFLLRFGFDENSLAILEIVSKGLATLFYNDTDETILDLINETSDGFLQPLMELNIEIEKNNSTDENIENQLKNLKLTSSPFTAKIHENEEESKTSMSDFELAETDLIDCLLRTNIIQRISYILGIIKPENTTVYSCLKILIRIARTNKDAAIKIITNSDLIKTLFDNFLPGLGGIQLNSKQIMYNYPQYLVLKLFRILISQNLSITLKLLSMDLLERIKNYLHTRDDIRSELIKVQIESLRIVHSVMLLIPDSHLYKCLLPTFRYMLEWHYQYIVYNKGGPYLIRQHASALFNAISSATPNEARSLLFESIQMCCCKWFYEAKKHGITEFSQSNLLASCLNCVAWCTKSGDKGFYEFIEKYLKCFIESNVFIEFLQNLSVSSIILKKAVSRRNIHEPLPNLGSVLIDSDSPQLIISQLYPIYLLKSLFKLIEILEIQKNNLLISSLMRIQIIEPFINYLKNISKYVNKNLATNYLCKSELKFIYKLICYDGFSEFLTIDQLIQVSFNLLCCMSAEHIQEIENIFDNIIFNNKNLQFDQNILTNWKQIYLETFIYPHSIVIPPAEMSLTIPCFSEKLLPSDWPYLLLKSLLNKYLQPISDNTNQESDFPESEIIKITLTFTELLEKNNLEITSSTEKLMYIMIIFMGAESVFLQSNMKELIKKYIQHFYKINENYKFEFDGVFEGKSKFENLYVLFLDHFQAASYGDSLFSSLVLIPLAQKYDSKWRKIVWSEHASVLRFLNCEENELLGSLNSYLEPKETDMSLIKCYARALNSNLLRPNSIAHKIAMHHVNNFKKTNANVINS